MPPERRVFEVARRQHGVVTTEQLAAAGFSKDGDRASVEDGMARAAAPGVYLVGALADRWTATMAAVLATKAWRATTPPRRSTD